MTVARAKTFRSGNSEAVRIPKEMAFGEGVELTLERSGDVLKIYPARRDITGAELVARLDALPSPSSVEVRDEEPLPERPGL